MTSYEPSPPVQEPPRQEPPVLEPPRLEPPVTERPDPGGPPAGPPSVAAPYGLPDGGDPMPPMPPPPSDRRSWTGGRPSMGRNWVGGGWRRRRATPLSVTLSGLLMIGLGMFMAISAAGQYAAGQPIAGGIRTTGTVVGVQTGQNCGKGGCSEYWVASIRFTTSDGKTVVFRGPEQSTITDGTRVAVSYDPHDPSGAHDLSVGVGSKLFFVAFGTFIAAFGLLFLVARIDWAHRRIVVTPVPLPEAGRYQRFSRTGPGVVVNAALVAGVVVLLVVLLF